MSDEAISEGRFHLHHLVALLGFVVVFFGLWLGWQTTHDAQLVDAALAAQNQASAQQAQGASLRHAQILFLREARQRRLRNTSLLVVGVGFAAIIGAALLWRLRSEIIAWVDPSDETIDRQDQDPPSRRRAA